MNPLEAIGFVLKSIFFLIVAIPWFFFALYKFYQSGWNLFTKPRHKMPERLFRDYKHKFVKLSDVKIHYVEEGDSSKPLLLFVHGFPEFWYSWRFQIKHFAETHHVVAIDQRGYGSSDKPEGAEHYKVALLAKDINEIIAKLGHQQAILVGHDWGGAVAWVTALLYPESISKLIVMNCPHPGAFPQVMWANKLQILKSWYIGFFQTAWLPEIYIGFNDYEMLNESFRGEFAGLKNRENFTDEDLEAWKAAFADALTPPINFYRAVVRHGESRDVLKRVVKPPTLIIWGEEDPFLAIECASFSERMCEKGKVVYVPRCSHWIQQDQPEAVNKIMEQFIN